MRAFGFLLSVLMLLCAITFGEEVASKTGPVELAVEINDSANNETESPNTTIDPTNTTIDPTNSTIDPTKSTTEPPTPTPEPPATPPPCGAAQAFDVNVVDSNGTTCIRAKMAVQISVVYLRTLPPKKDLKNETATFNIPKNVTATGSCDVNQTLILTFELDKINSTVELTFSNNNKKTELSEIKTNIVKEDLYFPDAVDKDPVQVSKSVSEMAVDEGHSYKCSKQKKIELSPGVTMLVSDVQVQSYVQGHDFLSAVECKEDEQDSSDIVPIAVGCALAGLVILVLIAYLIGRRRSRQKGYQSV